VCSYLFSLLYINSQLSLSDATIKKRVNGWVAAEVNVRERLQLEIEKLKSDKKAEYEVISLVHVLKSMPAFPCSLVPHTYPSLANGHLYA
jgi:hypothetical protein